MGSELEMIRWSDLAPDEQQRLLQRPVSRQQDLGAKVADIILRVRHGGDAALLELTRQFDRTEPQKFELGPAQLQTALNSIEPDLELAI